MVAKQPSENNTDEEPSNISLDATEVKPKDWVAGKCEEEWYLGKALQVEGQNIHIDVTKTVKNRHTTVAYQWKEDDRLLLPQTDVRKVDELVPLGPS